ncbi:MAG: hypothetical protein ED556_05665 [Winogradskyella sp.]|uniref:hypothetical protein n=1 Tax=Winogradskyella sp. TaxID=1883156 RepID=UPI000F3E0DF0|nr:hypothetical protein [Winogradskyella sp.]RNC86910.1 MAG: hypothetical protein ED556_05665 [Winogradskyella sp.]
MIKFFRKIRQKLLSENKFSKYLVYAIGEIVLVVIGILIALYINNQNEIKQAEKRSEALLNEVLLDLEHLISTSNNQLNFYFNKEKIFYHILQDKLTYEDYVNQTFPSLHGATIWYNGGVKRRTAYQNIINELNSIPDKYKSIINELSYIYNNKFNENYRDIIEELSNENRKNRAKNYEWYSYNISNNQNKEMIEFMLNDYRYKNEVKHYATMVGFHESYILRDKIRAQNCYLKIAKILNKSIDNSKLYMDAKKRAMLSGDWTSKQLPGFIAKVYEDESSLRYKTNIDSLTHTFYPITATRVIDDNGTFFEMIETNGELRVEQMGDIIFEKVNK